MQRTVFFFYQSNKKFIKNVKKGKGGGFRGESPEEGEVTLIYNRKYQKKYKSN